MSNPEDPKPKLKPPTPGSTGRSASARSIGEELGDLDFEPDALLDSLLSDDPHQKPEPAPPGAVDAPPADSGKLFEPETREWDSEGVTLAGKLEHTAPGPRTGDSVDDLLANAIVAPPTPAPQPPPAAPPRRSR